MKKVLITGANSYIGTSVEKYIAEHYAGECAFDTLDMQDGSWRQTSFAGYDAVFHVAGIAHSDSGKISKEKAALYYSVNTDLAVETATKAKADGVKQFIFMSSARQRLRRQQSAGGKRHCSVARRVFQSLYSAPAHDLRQRMQGKLSVVTKICA